MPGNGGHNPSGLDQLLKVGLEMESIFDAIESGEITRVTNVLLRNPNAVFERHNPPKIGSKRPQMGGVTPLLFAVQKARLDMVQLIYNQSEGKVGQEGSLLINIPDYGGTTPLIAACANGSREIFDFLIEKEADPHKARLEDEFRALEVVVMAKKDDFCCYALNKLVEAKTDIKDGSLKSKFTPLQVAIKEDNIDALKFLLSKLCCNNSKLDKKNTYSVINTIIDYNNLAALELVKDILNLQELTSKELTQISNKSNKIEGTKGVQPVIKAIKDLIENINTQKSLGKRKKTDQGPCDGGNAPSSKVTRNNPDLTTEHRVSIAALTSSEPSGEKGCGI